MICPVHLEVGMNVMAPQATSEAERRPLPSRERAYRRVLLVDDAPTFRAVIARVLTSRGYTVREAGDAAEALAALRDEPPELMLLDINLPDRTGWDVLRDLSAAGQHVPTVVLSAVRVNQARLTEFRPLAYLPKPFPIDALLRLLENRQPSGGEPEGA
jgi:DNA-binding response OmpR family regulator